MRRTRSGCYPKNKWLRIRFVVANWAIHIDVSRKRHRTGIRRLAGIVDRPSAGPNCVRLVPRKPTNCADCFVSAGGRRGHICSFKSSIRWPCSRKATNWCDWILCTYEAAKQRAQGDLAAAEAEIEFYRLQVKQFEKLVAEESAAQNKLDEAISSRDRVAGQIVGLRAQVASAELDLERTRIVAPFSGRVLAVDVDVGAVVEPGRELATIFANDFLEVVVGLSDDDVRLILGIWSLNQVEVQPTVRAQVEFAGWDD